MINTTAVINNIIEVIIKRYGLNRGSLEHPLGTPTA